MTDERAGRGCARRWTRWTCVSQVGKGHVEKGGYIVNGRVPDWHVPYGKYREGGKLFKHDEPGLA